MKKILFCLMLIQALLKAQEKQSMQIINGKLWLKNWTTGDSTQITGNIPPKIGQEGKWLSNNGVDFIWNIPNWLTTVPAQTFASITGKPTTVAGYGITDAYPLSGNPSNFLTSVPAQTFASITGKPTTVSGYGITDGVSKLASVDLTAQAANISTTTLYSVPSNGFYRISLYIAITQAGTTSSVMPSTTITYTDGVNSSVHSTVTTATSALNSLLTGFAQTSYVLYAKAGTNISYATSGYTSVGATVMQYHLRLRVESL